jgi:hypothetical protein
MASWTEIEAEAPDLVLLARRLFDAHVHKTIATLRRDGSPRISGIEILFKGEHLYFGSMPRAVKALDLLRDARFALHSGSSDPWEGDAKIAGTAIEIGPGEERTAVLGDSYADSHLFRADITELSVVRLGEPNDHLVIESWHPGRGVSSLRR